MQPYLRGIRRKMRSSPKTTSNLFITMHLLLAMPDFTSPEIWISLLTLTFLEIVLGVDNIIFITIASNRLPEHQKPRARNIGLLLAMAFRVILLFGISYLT